MNLSARINDIRDLLINGDLSEAITTTSLLVDEIEKDTFKYSIYLIHEQYNQLVRDNVEGNLTRENMLLERNKITLSILQLLQVIQYQNNEDKKKVFLYAQVAIAALSILLLGSLTYIFLNKAPLSKGNAIAAVEQNESAKATIVNSHPEDVLYNEDSMALQNLNTPTNDNYFDAVSEEVNYEESIFKISENEFGITLRYVQSSKGIDELIEAPINITISKLKERVIDHFNLRKSDFTNAGSNAEWYVFVNDKKIKRERKTIEKAGLFDYDLITIKYIGEEEEKNEEFIDDPIANLEENIDDPIITEELEETATSETTDPEGRNPILEPNPREGTQLAEKETNSNDREEPPVFERGETTTRSTRSPIRTIDTPPQLPEEITTNNEAETTREIATPPEEEKAVASSDKPKKETKKDRSKEEPRKKEPAKEGQTFSYLIFVPGETSVHLRQSNEVFNTKTNNYYTRNTFTEEDLNLLTNRKLLIRNKDGQKLYTTLRSSSNQYFVAVDGGVGATEEEFYTIVVEGKKMAAVPISSKEYDRLLKVANTSFKGPRISNVSIKGNGSDFTKKSIILTRK